MPRKVDLVKVLEKLDNAQKELVKKRVDAIRKLDISKDENLREQMLTLDGFRQDIENILVQLNDFISKNKILSLSGIRKPAAKTNIKKTRSPISKGRAKKNIGKSRAKPLPPIGTKLKGKYKGKEYWGDVTKDGIVIENFEGVFSSMSGAATAVTGMKTVNGWAFWKQIKL